VQNAGISPEAVSRKGQEERNKENRQRDSRIMAGLRNGIAERDWWLLRQALVREDGTMLVERQVCTTVVAFGDRGMVAIGEGCCFRGGRCPRILCGVLIPNGRTSIDHL
jgi:hypothetical protein